MRENDIEELEGLLEDQQRRSIFIVEMNLTGDQDGSIEPKLISSEIMYGWNDDQDALTETLYELDEIWKELHNDRGDGHYSLMFLMKVVRDGDGYRNWFYYEYSAHRFEYHQSHDEVEEFNNNHELENIAGFNFFGV
jgi:hypothetical protein